MHRPQRGEKAFTLIELIVVIVILALLAVIAIPTFNRVIKTSKLKTAEITAAALTREAIALQTIDQLPLLTQDLVTQASEDLPTRIASSTGTYAAGGVQGTRVLFGKWDFSKQERILSVRLGGPDATSTAGSTMGTAIWVPDAGCAFALGQAGSSSVKTWHLFDVTMENCNGQLAIGNFDSDDKLNPVGGPVLKAPKRPKITVSLDKTTKCVVITGDSSSAFMDVFVNGTYLDTIANTNAPQTKCYPNAPIDLETVSDDVVAIQNPTSDPSTNPGRSGNVPEVTGTSGTGGGTGTGTGGSGTGTGTGGSGTGTSGLGGNGTDSIVGGNDTTYLISWPSGAGGTGGTIWRNPSGGGTGTIIGTGTGTSGNWGYGYDRDVPSGNWSYSYVPSGNGPAVPAVVQPVKQPVKPGGTNPDGSSSDMVVQVVDGHLKVAWGSVDGDPAAPLDGYRLYRGVATDKAAAEKIVADRALLDTRSTPAKADVFYVDPDALTTGWWCYALSAYGPGGDSGKSNIACAQIQPPSYKPISDPTPTGVCGTTSCDLGSTNGVISVSGRTNMVGEYVSATFRYVDSKNYWKITTTQGYCGGLTVSAAMGVSITKVVNGATTVSSYIPAGSGNCSAYYLGQSVWVSFDGPVVRAGSSPYNTVLVTDKDVVDPATTTRYTVGASGTTPSVSAWAEEKNAPYKPYTVNGTATTTTLPVTWTASGNADVKEYRVYLNGKYVASTPGLNYAFADLTPKTTYTVQVSAVDVYGNEGGAQARNFTTPAS